MDKIRKSAARQDPTDAPGAFAEALVTWFDEHGDDLPWRRTRDPYAVLVSELMLQQTQVATVLGGRYFERWLEKFPDVAALAAADNDAVLKAWEGLGYYRRARNLKRAAEHIRDAHQGKFPRSPEEIGQLPGVGRYTTGAVLSLAFGHPAPIVDANVARVFSRLFAMHETIDSSAGQRRLWEHAAVLVPADGARAFNSGLMELGQKICTPTRPRCQDCPVAAWCRCEDPGKLPRKKPRNQTEHLVETVYLARRSGDGHVLVSRERGSRRTGFFRLPPAGKDSADWPVLLTTSYSITRYRVALTCLGAPEDYRPGTMVGEEGADDHLWCSADMVESLPMGAPYRKVLRRLLHETTMDT